MKNIILWLSLFCIPLYGFWIFPQWSKWQDYKIEHLKLDKTTKEKIAKIKDLQKTQAGFSKDGEGDELLSSIPATLKQELIMIDLQKIVQKTGFSFNSLNFSKRQNQTVEAPELLVNFSVQGKKSNIPLFLKAIETNKRFMGLDGLNFSTSKINGISIVDLSANVYSFSQVEK